MVEPSRVFSVRDNGLRCFVPPCFSWNLVDIETGEVFTVSELNFEKLTTNNSEVEEIASNLSSGRFNARGHMEAYTVSKPEQCKGRRLVVTGIESR